MDCQLIPTDPWWNEAYQNDFHDNPTLIRDAGINSSLILAWPQGGNPYSQSDEPADGCVDTGGDGIYDAPFLDIPNYLG